MNISVILPSRGRPEGLRKTLESLHSLAGDPESIEFLVKLDWDDYKVQSYDWLFEFPRVKVVVSDRGTGYTQMHVYNNLLAAESTGDWLLLLNDDALALTPKWDILLARHGPGPRVVKVVFPRVSSDTFSTGASLAAYNVDRHNDFPVLSRGLYSMLGHVAVTPCCDSYIHGVCYSVPGVIVTDDDVLFNHSYLRDEVHPHNWPTGGDPAVVHLSEESRVLQLEMARKFRLLMAHAKV